MKFCGLLIASFSLILLLIESSTGSLMCYSNTDFTENTEWNIQICNKTTNETSCLAQYRYHNDKLLPSYFGCHTTDTPCDPECNPVKGQGNDWSCCCSSDLCNEFLGDLGITTLANLCETANCSQNCMESNGVAQCYCDYGYTLDVDEKTCIGKIQIHTLLVCYKVHSLYYNIITMWRESAFKPHACIVRPSGV